MLRLSNPFVLLVIRLLILQHSYKAQAWRGIESPMLSDWPPADDDSAKKGKEEKAIMNQISSRFLTNAASPVPHVLGKRTFKWPTSYKTDIRRKGF